MYYTTFGLKYEPDRASELLSSANDMTCENACVYLEIGIQAGFLLIADMMKNIQNECQGEEETIDYHDRNRVMVKDIMRALELLTDETRDIQQACEILGKWGKSETGMQEEKQ